MVGIPCKGHHVDANSPAHDAPKIRCRTAANETGHGTAYNAEFY